MSSSEDSAFETGSETFSSDEDEEADIHYIAIKPLLNLLWRLHIRYEPDQFHAQSNAFYEKFAHLYVQRGLWNRSEKLLNLEEEIGPVDNYAAMGNAVLDFFNAARNNLATYVTRFIEEQGEA